MLETKKETIFVIDKDLQTGKYLVFSNYFGFYLKMKYRNLRTAKLVKNKLNLMALNELKRKNIDPMSLERLTP